MNKKAVLVPDGTFRSPLIRVTAILCAVAALSGFAGTLSLFFPGSIIFLDADSVTDDARLTWTLIHIGFIVFGFLCALLMAAGLFHSVRGKVSSGMDLLTRGTRVLRIAVTVVGVIALIHFIFGLIGYIIAGLSVNGGVIALFSILLAEFLLAAIVYFIFVMLRKFLECVGDTAASISYIITSQTLRSPSISMFSAVGFLILGLVNLFLFVNRITTITAWAPYNIPTVSSLVLYFSAAMFLFGGAACVLLFLYLRKFKMTSEYLLYKGTPVEEM